MQTELSDIELWDAYKNGDREAFTCLFRKYYPPLFTYGIKLTDNHPLLEDCLQELFYEMWQSKKSSEVKSVRAYLFKSLKYKIWKTLQKNKVNLDQAQRADGEMFEWNAETFLIAKEEDEEKRKNLLAALDQLTNRQREIVYLKYYQGLEYEEVSEIMNLNYQASRNLLYQAIKSLKNILQSIAVFILL